MAQTLLVNAILPIFSSEGGDQIGVTGLLYIVVVIAAKIAIKPNRLDAAGNHCGK